MYELGSKEKAIFWKNWMIANLNKSKINKFFNVIFIMKQTNY